MGTVRDECEGMLMSKEMDVIFWQRTAPSQQQTSSRARALRKPPQTRASRMSLAPSNACRIVASNPRLFACPTHRPEVNATARRGAWPIFCTSPTRARRSQETACRHCRNLNAGPNTQRAANAMGRPPTSQRPAAVWPGHWPAKMNPVDAAQTPVGAARQ